MAHRPRALVLAQQPEIAEGASRGVLAVHRGSPRIRPAFPPGPSPGLDSVVESGVYTRGYRRDGRSDRSISCWNGGIVSSKRRVEVFSAGCMICGETVELVKSLTCSSCEVIVLDMHDDTVAQRAAELGIESVPAVVIDGTLAGCCAGRGPDAETLRAAGLGQPIV